jgi:hypothetical protein
MGGKTEQAKHLFSIYPSLIMCRFLCITALRDRARTLRWNKNRSGPMIKTPRNTVCWLTAIVFSCSLIAVAGTLLKSGPGLHSAMPAGYEVLTLKPSNMNLSLMGLIECPELEGAQHVAQGLKSRVITADGARMQQFPHHFSFRITASLRKIVLDPPLNSINVPEDPNDFLLKLRFRVKAYHGLEVREITPESVEMIGIPADITADERVYRISISVDNMPVTDRFVVEVLSPQNELLAHFPFTLL